MNFNKHVCFVQTPHRSVSCEDVLAVMGVMTTNGDFFWRTEQSDHYKSPGNETGVVWHCL